MNTVGIIILGGHVQAYGILRVYGINSIPCIVIDSMKSNIARHSKYCHAFYHCEYNSIISLLRDFIDKKLYHNWLLIPTDDYYLRLISQQKDLLGQYYNVTVDSWGVLIQFFNKRYSYPLAMDVGIPTPLTFYPNSLNELMELHGRIPFPCIVKPAVMLDFYRHFKTKVFICNSEEELKNNYNKAREIISANELIIQEVIPGTSDNQYSACFFFDRVKIYNFLVGRRKRQHPLDFGNATTFAETVIQEQLVDYSKKLLMRANFQGICEVEFKFDVRDNTFKFLEVNPRTWKWHLIAEKAGIPFLMSLYQFCLTGNAIIKYEYNECCWQDIISDIPTILQMKMRGNYIRPDSISRIQAVYTRDDLLPFIYQCIMSPYLALKR